MLTNPRELCLIRETRLISVAPVKFVKHLKE